ncbi:hypothetical protein CF328_g3629 [Tilletia controversa]|nr:hypothetical protein CF328_g3629 [Tilletia controversa]
MLNPPRQLLKIPYLPDGGGHVLAQQTVDLFLPHPSESPPRLLIFIHGGAWRAGDNEELHPLALNLATPSSDAAKSPIAVALINYRLSPYPDQREKTGPVSHPAHIEDVHAALRYLLIDRPTRHPDEYQTEGVILSGHSVGAWLVAASMLDPPSSPSTHPTSASSLDPVPVHRPLHPSSLRAHIHAYVLLDGIYDIDALLDEYSSVEAYATFVGQAFDPPQFLPAEIPTHGRYQPASIRTWVLADQYAYSTPASSSNTHLSQERDERTRDPLPRIRIVHSRKDELLSLAQPELAWSYLHQLLSTQTDHPSKWIQTDYDSITTGHFDMLPTQELANYFRTQF